MSGRWSDRRSDLVLVDFVDCWYCVDATSNALPLTPLLLFLICFDCRYAEPDCVPPLLEGAGLPVRGAQRVRRHVPSHHRRATPSARYCVQPDFLLVVLLFLCWHRLTTCITILRFNSGNVALEVGWSFALYDECYKNYVETFMRSTC